MTGPTPTARTRMMVEAYICGDTLEEVGLSFEGVGPPGNGIFSVGTCSKCEVPLWAKRREARELCGHCETTLL